MQPRRAPFNPLRSVNLRPRLDACAITRSRGSASARAWASERVASVEPSSTSKTSQSSPCSSRAGIATSRRRETPFSSLNIGTTRETERAGRAAAGGLEPGSLGVTAPSIPGPSRAAGPVHEESGAQEEERRRQRERHPAEDGPVLEQLEEQDVSGKDRRGVTRHAVRRAREERQAEHSRSPRRVGIAAPPHLHDGENGEEREERERRERARMLEEGAARKKRHLLSQEQRSALDGARRAMRPGAHRAEEESGLSLPPSDPEHVSEDAPERCDGEGDGYRQPLPRVGAKNVRERERGTDGSRRGAGQAEEQADEDRRLRTLRADQPEGEEQQQEEERFGVRGREEERHGIEEQKGQRTPRALRSEARPALLSEKGQREDERDPRDGRERPQGIESREKVEASREHRVEREERVRRLRPRGRRRAVPVAGDAEVPARVVAREIGSRRLAPRRGVRATRARARPGAGSRHLERATERRRRIRGRSCL